MTSWREALGGGRNLKRNVFFALSFLNFLIGRLSSDRALYLLALLCLSLSYLVWARLELSWEFPKRIVKGDTFILSIHLKNKAFSKSKVQGDLVRDLVLKVKTQKGLAVRGKSKKILSELEASKTKRVDFKIRADKTLSPDLYWFRLESESSAGKTNTYFEIYVTE
ncbi:MAG: hypothetical protein ACE5K0_11440 [Candidatus Methanofastidiosia archaeon]